MAHLRFKAHDQLRLSALFPARCSTPEVTGAPVGAVRPCNAASGHVCARAGRGRRKVFIRGAPRPLLWVVPLHRRCSECGGGRLGGGGGCCGCGGARRRWQSNTALE